VRGWVLGALALAVGCTRTPAQAPSPAPWSDAWLEAEATRYLDDPAHRRRSLEASLQNHDNTYARLRLSHYGLHDHGWDALPPWNPRSVPVTTTPTAGPLPADTAPLWDGQRPRTRAAWRRLGRAVFEGYPMRAEAFMAWGLGRPETLVRYGVEPDATGVYPGLRRFRDLDGQTRVGITCALCHTAVEGGVTVYGRARRRFDYGALRGDFHAATGAPLEPGLAARMRTWGPGRADVTEDEAEDPVTIPDLWGLRHQSSLTQAGTLRHIGPAALAIRQETQLLDSNHGRARPPRELAWALTVFLYDLEPPAPAPSPHAPEVLAEGRAAFTRECARCHANAAYGGVALDARHIGTHPALAMGSARGTGLYRTSPLVGIGAGAPYLHDGSVPTLAALLDPARLARTPGHAYGTHLAPHTRAALIAWLETL
jgi:mono/diheme cytochrome c family protein